MGGSDLEKEVAAVEQENELMNGPAPGDPLIVLASASPRRRQLLEFLQIPHKVLVADVDERSLTAATPREFALKAAFLKAGALDSDVPADTIVIAADTVVAIDTRIFFKPVDEADAIRMLQELSGQTHQVITGIAVREVGKATQLDAVSTDVHIKALSEEDIQKYVATGEPLDKAGAYGIQGLGGSLVDRIDGDYFNVVGLPIDRLIQMLSVHVDIMPFRTARRGLTPETFRQQIL